ncbi:hypothetical protein [Bacillus chungangensis]|uniref:Uncharacterized protein n=1 Tax=Bacillus chungangensis TaxID=587633 RepID=A0ABT9WT95_9BACI|nr:hypothetical protein [Bacillus chungangensis]MDQ0175965.1 hypothetical protein [Bacillus chungangensis]
MKGKFVLGVLSVMMAFSFATSASAATAYVKASERGVKNLAWSESKLIWKVDSGRVTASDGYQDQSGFFVRNKGASKVTSLSSSTQHAWNYKNEFLAGAQIGGVTLGFTRTITDRIIGYSTGDADFEWDI